MPEPYKWVPLEDGTTHINIYTKGQTTLGRWLSNLAEIPVEIDGVKFRSMENYWFWLQASDEAKPKLVRCTPWHAKNYFKTNPSDRVRHITDEPCLELFKHAMKLKLFQHPAMAKVFAESTLPLTHYYQYGGKPVHAGYEWIVEHWESIRSNPKFQKWIQEESR
jgi:hypothetical protein